MAVSGIILAGGQSSRMGQDKTLMSIETQTLIERTVKELRKVSDEIIIASNQFNKYNLPGTFEVPDIFSGFGPLGGIHAGLKAASYPYSFIVAGDMPLFTADLAEYLLTRTDEDYDVIAPEVGGSWEPLCAVYSQSCLQAIEKYLEAGIRQVFQFYKNVRVLKICEQELVSIGKTGDLFYNLNTPEDYKVLLAKKKARSTELSGSELINADMNKAKMRGDETEMDKNLYTPVISFVAKSGSGKTTLLEKVISIIKAKGYKLAVVKHDAHQFEMDHPGKDTWKMAQAGADVVAISSPEKVAIIEKVQEERTLDEVIDTLPEVDIILTEGFKRSNKPKIEVSRSDVSRELLCEPKELLAIASDISWENGVPCYSINDAEGIANVIIEYARNFRHLGLNKAANQ